MRQMLDWLSARAGIPFDVSPKLFPANKADDPQLKCKFQDAEIRYIVSWVVRFLDATAKVENGTVIVRPRSEQPVSDPVFDCSNETEGEWKKRIEKGLLTPLTYSFNEKFAFDQWAEFIAHKANVPLVIDPTLFASDRRTAKIGLDVKTQPCGEVLRSGLASVGMTYRIQGCVVFVTEQEEKMPNQEIHGTQ